MAEGPDVEIEREEPPTLGPVPAVVRGFRVRVDLRGAEPPVWRRLELPGDLTLARLHDVIQEAMGWTNSHLHRFRTGRDRWSPSFVTHFDIEEGDEGVLEDDVRLDQLVAEEGDELWYGYDFGDGWDHSLVVEEVLVEPPEITRCLDGRMACPPEDCGGIGGYADLAAWVRSGCDPARLPESFDGVEHARAWLPLDWHPDHFEVEAANAALTIATAEPVPVSGELGALADQLDHVGVLLLRQVLGRSDSHGSIEVSDAEAARLTETYRTFLDVIGDGVALTSAGRLPPAVVEEVAQRIGITDWWFGKANREDRTPPVAQVRGAARALGLVSVRKGRLTPTAVVRSDSDPQALWRHIVARLPIGTKAAERDAGWMALAVVASGAPAREWYDQISELLYALGWRDGYDRSALPPARSATLEVLRHLAGAAGARWHDLAGTDPAVAATARVAIRRS